MATQKQIKSNTKKEIKRILKMIEDKANYNLDKAINCGALAEDSEFLDANSLLAMALIEDATKDFTIKTPEYRKEADNLKMFI